MRFTRKQAYAAAAVVAAGCAALGLWYYVRSRGLGSPRAMLACLPRSGAVSVYLDMDGLRSSGVLDMLAGSKAVEDADYRKFIEGTGFDYRRDLDAVAGTFAGRITHFVLRGRFDWSRLRNYALAQGGKCNPNSVCRTTASDGRYVSFYPLRGNALALAVAPDEWAVLDVAPHPVADNVPLPDQPVWISVSGAALREVQTLPTGSRSFISPLESADHIVFSMGPSGDRFQIEMNVSCPSDTVASDIVTRLEGATNMLRKLLARENVQPSSRDLSGILVAGTFRRDGSRVRGTWPVARDFLAAVAGGKIQ